MPDFVIQLQFIDEDFFFAIPTEADENLSQIVEALKVKSFENIRKLGPNFGYYVDKFCTYNFILFLENRMVAKAPIMMRLQMGHSGKFRMSNYLWWPHMKCEIWITALKCKKCIETSKKLKSVFRKKMKQV